MISVFDKEYSFLSNYFDSPFEYEGIKYPTNEHFFQAMKTIDITERKMIAAAATPGKSKRMGRTITLRADWEKVKNDVMLTGLRLKFQIPELKQKLLDTGAEVLVEGNWWHDCTWGRCNCERCQGRGENRLGQLLMQIRDELKETE